MQVAQFVHTLNYGDAISGEAVTIAKALNDLSIPNKIYTVHSHQKMAGYATHYSELERDLAASDAGEWLFLLHYSIRSPLNEIFFQGRGVTKAVVYHNLTPEHFYLGYNTRVVEDLIAGRSELPKYLAVCDLIIADSPYNKRELESLGFSNIEVLPLPFDLEKWKIPANSGIGRILRVHGGRNILHVGRIAPNKCLHDAIKAFYFYHHKIDRKSKLWFVGIDYDTEIYAFELRRLIAELRLKDAVHFSGSVADSELRAFYENSDLYLCMSEHEGYCMPLVEAMYFGVPVIAYNATAVGDTLGGAGLLVNHKSAAELAEAMNFVFSDVSLKQDMIQRGKHRAHQLTSESFRQLLAEKLLAKVKLPRTEEALLHAV